MSTSHQDIRSSDTVMLPLKKSCQSCNTAKLKCNGHRPQCARCSRRGTPCVYAPAKPVGRPPRRVPLRTVARPLHVSPLAALRGLRPTYYSSTSTPPPNNDSEPTESTEPYDPYKPSECGPSPPPPQQPGCSVDNRDSESCIAAAFLELDDGMQSDFHATELYPCPGTTSELDRGKTIALGLSFLPRAFGPRTAAEKDPSC